MGNRSKYVVVGSVAAALGTHAVVRARRRARLGRAARGFGDSVMPSVGARVSTASPTLTADEAHAPGHQHMPPEPLEELAPWEIRQRVFATQRQGGRHPSKG